jgi:hypothetical protein
VSWDPCSKFVKKSKIQGTVYSSAKAAVNTKIKEDTG